MSREFAVRLGAILMAMGVTFMAMGTAQTLDAAYRPEPLGAAALYLVLLHTMTGWFLKFLEAKK